MILPSVKTAVRHRLLWPESADELIVRRRHDEMKMWPGIVSVLIFPALGVNELDVRPLFLPIRLAELSEEPVERRLSGLPVYFFLPRKSKGEPQIPHPEIAVEHSGEFLYGVRLVAFDFSILDFFAFVPRRTRWPPLFVGIQPRRISVTGPEMILYSM